MPTPLSHSAVYMWAVRLPWDTFYVSVSGVRYLRGHVRCCLLRHGGVLDVQVQNLATGLEAALDDAQKEKQRLLDANAVLEEELSSLREKQKSAEAMVGLLMHVKCMA